jgi:large subunit ribosomal protein L22
MTTYYSTELDSTSTARAYGRDLDCSPKSGRNVARAIKGMPVARAKRFLSEVAELKTPVPFKVRMRKIHHRRGTGFGPGKYPVGTVTRMLKVLESAEANAEYKGLDKERLVIVHATAYQGTVNQAFTPRAQGRATPHYNRRCNFEVIVRQLEEEEASAAEDAKSTRGKSRAAKSARAPKKESASKPSEKSGKAAEKTAAKHADKPHAEKPAEKPATKAEHTKEA